MNVGCGIQLACDDTEARGVRQIHPNCIHWIRNLVQRIGTV